MARTQNIHQLIAVLLVGFAIGVISGQWYAKENSHKHWKKGDVRQHMLDKFNQKLSLTAEQQTQVAAIFDANQPKMLALHEEMRPKFEAIRNSAQAEIRAILNPDQQVKFDEMNAEREKRRKERSKFFGL